MEALEIIIPTLQERYDKITASVANLDPRVGEPWPKLQNFKEYMVSVADVEKPRCRKCGVNLLWAESMICVGCGAKTEVGSRGPPEIEFTSTLAYSRYLDALWASGKLKNEDNDKQGRGDSQWGSIDGSDSRRGSASILPSDLSRGSASFAASDVRRGSGSTGTLSDAVGSIGSSSGAESRRGSASDPTSQTGGWLGPSTDRPESASRLSVGGGQSSSISGRSGSISSSNAEMSGQLFGSPSQTKSMNGLLSGVQNAVLPSSNRSGSQSEQSGQPASTAAALPSQANFASEVLDKRSGPTARQDSSSSRVSDAPSDPYAADLTGFDDFGEEEQFQSAGSNAAIAMDDFMGFDNGDFFVRQTASASGNPEEFVSAEHSLLINQLETLDLSQGQVEAPSPDSDEALIFNPQLVKPGV